LLFFFQVPVDVVGVEREENWEGEGDDRNLEKPNKGRGRG